MGLDSQGHGDLSGLIATSVLQQLLLLGARRREETSAGRATRPPRFLILGEASWLDQHLVRDLLAKARAAGMAVILVDQGPMSWEWSHPGHWQQIMANVNVAVVMRQGTPDNQARAAIYLGSGPEKEPAQWVELLANLRLGEAVVRVGIERTTTVGQIALAT